MNVNTNDWRGFKLGRLFDIKKGKRLTSEDQEDGDNLYVGAIDSNNGIANHIGQNPIHEGNTISLSYNGSVGEAFYQPDPYWATDDVNALYSKYEGFNESIGLFISTVIRVEKYRFSYGRKWDLDNMNNTEICLPIQHNDEGATVLDETNKYSDEGYIPDWELMIEYIESLHNKPLTTKNKNNISADLGVDNWEPFLIKDLFDVELATGDIKLDEVKEGDVPLISSGENNNGIAGYIDSFGDGISKMFPANRITVDMFCNAFYQNEPFYAVSHGRVNILIPKFELTQSIGLFICTIIKQEKYKYSYGRAVYSEVAKNMEIMLPTVSPKMPDWAFMENYIKNLPYGDRIQAVS